MCSDVSLIDFLSEAGLSHFVGDFRNVLHVENVEQLHYMDDHDFAKIGLLPAELFRLKRTLKKYKTSNYFGRFAKILHPKKQHQPQRNHRSMPSSASYHSTTDIVSQQSRIPLTNSGFIRAESLTFREVIFKGPTSSVHRALWSLPENKFEVAVKIIEKDWRNWEKDFRSDVEFLRALDHPSITRFFGVVLENDSSFWVVSELAANRSLIECLRDPLLRPSLSVLVLCEMATQVCDGLDYLEKRKIFHANLGARNVLVFRELKVKVVDVCFPHDQSAYSNYDSAPNKRTAWLAPECFSGKQYYSSEADVWAFGVTLWEMFSFGAQPFAGFTDEQIKDVVERPYCKRLERPEWCPREYYDLMLKCWNHDRFERPTFKYLLKACGDCKPEQVQVVSDSAVQAESDHLDRKMLKCTTGDIIVVLDNDPPDANGLWKGVLENRVVGLFDPSNTVTFLGAGLLPSKSCTEIGFSDVGQTRSSLRKQKINRSQISRPQGDFRHIGHVGVDGAHFGDGSLIASGVEVTSIRTPSRSSGLVLSDNHKSSSSSLGSQLSKSRSSTPDLPAKMVINGQSRKPENAPLFTRVDRVVPSHPGKPPVIVHPSRDRFDNPVLHLDLGPSLMDEVFGTFQSSGSFSSSVSVPSANSLPVKVSAAPTFVPPSHSLQTLTSSDPITSDTSSITGCSNLLSEKLDAPPAKPLTPIAVGLKPVTSSDEKVLDNFFQISTQIASKRDSICIERTPVPPSPLLDSGMKSRFSFRRLKSRLGSSNSETPPSPKLSASQISKPVELTDLITEESKEAYRALVEEGAVLHRTPSVRTAPPDPPSPAVMIPPIVIPSKATSSEEQSAEDDANPLKLLRKGAGSARMVYKPTGALSARANFSRTVSVDSSKVALSARGLGDGNVVREEIVESGPTESKVERSDSISKRAERPSMPPPLPPRDRTKPAQSPSAVKPRVRQNPLVLPGSTGEAVFESPGSSPSYGNSAHSSHFAQQTIGKVGSAGNMVQRIWTADDQRKEEKECAF